MNQITQILQNWSDADANERNNVFTALYSELRRIARMQLQGESKDAVLQPTVIANEAYLRLVQIDQMNYSSRAHFFAVSATLIRRVLIDFSRSRNAVKRDGGNRVTLTSNFSKEEAKPIDILELDEALTILKEIDADTASILEARYFGGLTIKEVAEVTSLSKATVKRKSQVGIAWLRNEIDGV
ncbi:MAG: ECF-type sigma factor [Gammaproteobacteria bacterium]